MLSICSRLETVAVIRDQPIYPPGISVLLIYWHWPKRPIGRPWQNAVIFLTHPDNFCKKAQWRKLPYFPANKLRLVFSSENESFSPLLPNKPNQKISLPNYRYLFFFLQQSLSGIRYIHYAPTHVLYNGGDDFNGGDAGTAW